ncbi:MAG: leucyl aminopeptidase [Lachnospiraceae bacterium]|nr:leucyl aminopeptidase [Lachnospiraceae bacterium]
MDQSILKERHELVSGRIREILTDNPVPARYRDYFFNQAAFLMSAEDIFEKAVKRESTDPVTEDALSKRSMEECIADHEVMYAALRDHYETSWLNPGVCEEYLGDAARILGFLAAELRSGIAYVFEGRLFEWTILLELFAEIYACFLEDPADLQEAQQTIYWHFHDYTAEFIETQVKNLVCPDGNFFTDIIMHADFNDLTYLYRYGLPVSENELQTAAFLNQLSQDQIQAMADTYTEGYRIGFEVTGKDLSKKKTVSLHYCIGFERMMRAAIENFRKIGLEPTIAREPVSSFAGLGAKRGAYSTSVNRQYEYDHREDRALYFDKAFLENRLTCLENSYNDHKEEALQHGGPAVLEVFGEEPFSPETKPSAIRFSEAQQKLSVYQMSRAGEITNRFIPGEERSFTIIAYPIPEIAQDSDADRTEEECHKRFEEIFAETVKINTLDYKTYQKIQQCIIDVLDTAQTVEIKGKNGNETDLSVRIHPLTDPEKQTAFENCVADVNIPVGEVFTSPVLEGTNGVLHVSEVFLNGLQFQDLKIQFTDGFVTSYSCGNFTDPKEGEKYIRENVLMHHETLPMGEFAIGTNTTAYRMGRDFGITHKLPILIAEKTGPHFAVGDTCYSHAEDTAVYNPDGKEIIARDNAVSRKRKENVQEAYFNCHTDITIPFDELGSITAVAKDGTRQDVIRDGMFVIPGTEELNLSLTAPE